MTRLLTNAVPLRSQAPRGCRGDPANHPLGIFVLEDDAPPKLDFIASRSNRSSQCLASSDERTKRTALVHGRACGRTGQERRIARRGPTKGGDAV